MRVRTRRFESVTLTPRKFPSWPPDRELKPGLASHFRIPAQRPKHRIHCFAGSGAKPSANSGSRSPAPARGIDYRKQNARCTNRGSYFLSQYSMVFGTPGVVERVSVLITFPSEETSDFCVETGFPSIFRILVRWRSSTMRMAIVSPDSFPSTHWGVLAVPLRCDNHRACSAVADSDFESKFLASARRFHEHRRTNALLARLSQVPVGIPAAHRIGLRLARQITNAMRFIEALRTGVRIPRTRRRLARARACARRRSQAVPSHSLGPLL